MKTIKSILTVTAITAGFASSLFAADTLLSPRATGSSPVVVSAGSDADYAHNETALGNAAKAKTAPATAVAASKSDPNLLGCERLGKATCSKNPCEGKMAACCKK